RLPYLLVSRLINRLTLPLLILFFFAFTAAYRFLFFSFFQMYNCIVVPHLSKVADIWKCVYHLKNIEQSVLVISPMLINSTFVIVDITKNNRICRTSLL